MKRRIRPIANAIDMAVFDRVEVNIIHVSRKLVVVSNLVLPEPSLPDGRFAVQPFGSVHPFFVVQGVLDLLGKTRLDQPPAF